MRDKLNQPLTVEGKNSNKRKSTRGKSFGYQVLGFGAGSSASFIEATGGTVTEDGDFKIHTFTGPGTFCVSGAGADAEVDYMVIAGGGAGGNWAGGGGGAGGFRESHNACVSGPYTASPLATPTSLPVSVQGYPITIGGGGSGGPYQTGSDHTPGANSIFSSITSAGGGRGRGAFQPDVGSGGSGGGANGLNSSGSGNTPPVSPPQGNPGSPGQPGPNSTHTGGGGGGAQAAGTQGTGTQSGPGGNGTATGISGSDVTRAGGGGSGANSQSAGAGGPGGGGAGSGNSAATPGTANTGGGGGGGGGTNQNPPPSPAPSGNGGSGVVIIRYQFK